MERSLIEADVLSRVLAAHARAPFPRSASTEIEGDSRMSARRRELSQNFLRDQRVAADVAQQLGGSSLPVVELGAGAGALTAELVRRGYQVTAVELDRQLARVLRQRFGRSIQVIQADMLHYRFPDAPHNLVSNVPYGITTPLLRLLLQQRWWSVAVLMVQWEVARKRAGSTGATLLTASWWPWYEFEVVRRVPARAFRPVPRVDSGVVRLTRRDDPLVPRGERRAYQRFVGAVFTGRGAGLAATLRPHLSRAELRRWLNQHGVTPTALPTELTPWQWASLYHSLSSPT